MRLSLFVSEAEVVQDGCLVEVAQLDHVAYSCERALVHRVTLICCAAELVALLIHELRLRPARLDVAREPFLLRVTARRTKQGRRDADQM